MATTTQNFSPDQSGLFTYDQIKNATADDIKNNKALGLAAAAAYNPTTDPNSVYQMWVSGNRSFDADKPYMFKGNGGYVNLQGDSFLNDAVADYTQSKSPQALAKINEYLAGVDQYKNIGIDVSGIPSLVAARNAIGLGTSQDNQLSPTTSQSIPFKTGLSDVQKQSITNLLQTRPDPSQWSTTDQANWNYATGNSPLPTNSSSNQLGAPVQSAMAGNGNTANTAGFSDTQIQGLNAAAARVAAGTANDTDRQNLAYAQSKGWTSDSTGNSTGINGTDSQSGTHFSTGNSELDQLFEAQTAYFTQQLQNGQKINPQLTLDPQTVQQFLDQSTSEIHPHYQALYDSIKEELGQSVGNLQKQYELNQADATQKFKNDLMNSRESAAGTGTYLSGRRSLTENIARDAAQRGLESNALTAEQQAGNKFRTAEQQIGSNMASSVNSPNFERNTLSLEGQFGSVNGQNQGNQYYRSLNIPGSLQAQEQADIAANAANLGQSRLRSLNASSNPTPGV